MGWLNDRLNSSIGKKVIMAVTGILLILFLVVHLLNNLLLYLGPDIFNENVARLEAVKPLVRVIEVILALIFIFHIYNAIRLYFENKKDEYFSLWMKRLRDEAEIEIYGENLKKIFEEEKI